MSEMEDKLGAILSNPQMMHQIFSLAQSLGQEQPTSRPPEPQNHSIPDIDPAMLAKFAGLARQSGTDSQQQALLSALSPYLSRERVGKLEKAMQAAKLARLASSFLNSGGLSLLTGR